MTYFTASRFRERREKKKKKRNERGEKSEVERPIEGVVVFDDDDDAVFDVARARRVCQFFLGTGEVFGRRRRSVGDELVWALSTDELFVAAVSIQGLVFRVRNRGTVRDDDEFGDEWYDEGDDRGRVRRRRVFVDDVCDRRPVRIGG